ARLSRRYDAAVAKRRQQLKDQVIPRLRGQMQERFRRLEETRRQIDAQPIEDQKWFREVLRKLDYLLEKFLMFAEKEAQFRNYLRSLRGQATGDVISEGRRESRATAEDRRRPRGLIDAARPPLRPQSPA